MLLSKLVFLSVKNVIYLDDSSFNYINFCAGDFDNDIDYSTNINNVFSPLNEAISRLSDLDRIPYLVSEVSVSEDKIIDLSQLTKQARHVIGVAAVDIHGNYKKLAYTMFGRDKIRVISPFSRINNKFFVEYVEIIPTFDESDIVAVEENDGEIVDGNIDLYEYGIDEAMANYIIEYVQGKLLEPIAPELANMHVTRAEAYFNNLPVAVKNFPQQVVSAQYKVNGW